MPWRGDVLYGKGEAQLKTVKFEKNIPIPPRKNYGGFMLDAMKVNDSFFVSFSSYKNADCAKANVYYHLRPYKKHNKFAFTLREVKGGIRVWRIK